MAAAALSPRVYAVVFAGGSAGGAVRIALDLAVPTGAWAWDIVAINVFGSALLGAILGWFTVHSAPWWAPALGPGLMGGFTTFSALAAPHAGAPFEAGVTLVATAIVATVVAALGWRSGQAFAVRTRAAQRAGEFEGDRA